MHVEFVEERSTRLALLPSVNTSRVYTAHVLPCWCFYAFLTRPRAGFPLQTVNFQDFVQACNQVKFLAAETSTWYHFKFPLDPDSSGKQVCPDALHQATSAAWRLRPPDTEAFLFSGVGLLAHDVPPVHVLCCAVPTSV